MEDKLMKVYRKVFPKPTDLVEYLSYNNDGEFLTIDPDYNCFIDIYEKWGEDISDDDLDEFNLTILMIMSIDLLNCSYKVEIKKYSLTAIKE